MLQWRMPPTNHGRHAAEGGERHMQNQPTSTLQNATETTDAAALLARARAGGYPPNWYVWPLQGSKVRRGLIRWAIYAIGGFAFFIPALFVMIPDNFSRDGGVAVA